MEKFLKKTYTGKFITLKPAEAKILSKIKKDDKLELLKKIPDMDKVLKPLEIYETKITHNDSIKYLNLIAKVNRYQIKAFEDQVKEVKDALEKYNKAKLKGKKPQRRRGGGRNITVDDRANAIKEASKEVDLVKKLTSSLEKAMRSKDPVKGTLEALASWAQDVCVEKVGKPALKSLEYIFNNPMSIPSTLLGWTRGKWLITPGIYRIIDGAIKCIGSVLISSGAVILAKRLKDWWNSSSMVFGGNPPRRDRPPSGPDFGGGGGGDDDDNDDKPKGPSDLDRLRQLQILKELEKSRQNIEQGIKPGGTPTDPRSGKEGGGKGDGGKGDGGKEDGGKEGGGKGDGGKGDGGNPLSGGASSNSPTEPRSGKSGFSTSKTIITEGGGNPSSNINPSTLGLGILGTGLLGAGLIRASRAGLALNDPPLPRSGPQINQDELDRDVQSAKELEELEDGAVKHDKDADEQAMLDMFNRDQDARQSAMGAFIGGSGGKTAIDLGLQAGLLAAATASNMFKTVRQNIKRSETIDDVVQGKQDLQDIKKEELEDFQNMVDTKPPAEPLRGETTTAPPETPPPDFEISDDEEDQTLSSLEQGIDDVMSLDYIWNEHPTVFSDLTIESKHMINDLLSKFPKDDDSEFVRRLKTLQLRIAQTERSLTDRSERGVTLGSLQSQILPNVQDRVAEAERSVNLVRGSVLSNIAQRANQNRAQQERVAQLKPSRDTSLDSAYTDTSASLATIRQLNRRVPPSRRRERIPTPLAREPSLDTSSDPPRSIPPRQGREIFARQQAQAVVRGPGRPRDILTQITGVPSNRETLQVVRERVTMLGNRFGFNGPGIFEDFLTREGVLNTRGSKLNSNGRKQLGVLLSKIAEDFGIPIEKFFSGI